jgi:hypothetical protein
VVASVQLVPVLTLSRAAAALLGVAPTELRLRQELTPEAILALKPMLEVHGFDVTRPIRVSELPDYQGFHLIQ